MATQESDKQYIKLAKQFAEDTFNTLEPVWTEFNAVLKDKKIDDAIEKPKF